MQLPTNPSKAFIELCGCPWSELNPSIAVLIFRCRMYSTCYPVGGSWCGSLAHTQSHARMGPTRIQDPPVIYSTDTPLVSAYAELLLQRGHSCAHIKNIYIYFLYSTGGKTELALRFQFTCAFISRLDELINRRGRWSTKPNSSFSNRIGRFSLPHLTYFETFGSHDFARFQLHGPLWKSTPLQNYWTRNTQELAVVLIGNGGIGCGYYCCT